MRLATGLMMIGIVAASFIAVNSVPAFAEQAGSSGMLIPASAAVITFTGAQTSVPATLANWKGGHHKGWHGGHKGWHGGWYGGKWRGGYYYPYYGKSWRYNNKYCVWDPYTYSWYC